MPNAEHLTILWGGVLVIKDTMIFDESQITCPTNGLNPKWGGASHSLTRECGRTVVIIREDDRADSIQGRYNDKD